MAPRGARTGGAESRMLPAGYYERGVRPPRSSPSRDRLRGDDLREGRLRRPGGAPGAFAPVLRDAPPAAPPGAARAPARVSRRHCSDHGPDRHRPDHDPGHRRPDRPSPGNAFQAVYPGRMYMDLPNPVNLDPVQLHPDEAPEDQPPGRPGRSAGPPHWSRKSMRSSHVRPSLAREAAPGPPRFSLSRGRRRGGFRRALVGAPHAFAAGRPDAPHAFAAAPLAAPPCAAPGFRSAGERGKSEHGS